MQREPTIPKIGIGKGSEEEVQRGPILVTGMTTGVSQDPSPWKAGVQAGKAAFEKLSKTKPDFAFIFATSGYDLEPVVKGVLQSIGKDVPYFAAKILGTLFTENSILNNGVAVAIVKSDSYKFTYSIGTNVHQGLHSALEKACIPVLDQIKARKIEGFEHLNLFLLLDSYVNGDILVTELSRIVDRYDPSITFYGGILDYAELSKDCQLHMANQLVNGGVACIGIYSKTPPAMSHGHGLHPLVPKRATKVGGDVIYHLDERPAFEVWKEFLVKKGIPEAEIIKNPTKFLGMYQFGVPDPAFSKYPRVRIAVGITKEGGIKLAGDIPENSTVWFMEARKDRMEEAVSQCIDQAFNLIDQRKPIGSIVIESIHRFSSLGDGFFEEINLFQRKLAMPFIGFTTFGEFLRPTPEFKWFHNSSFVLQILSE